jgi:hypothetical protein
MSEQKRPPGQRGERDEHLILDEVTDQLATTFRLLSGDPNEAAERAFADIGVNTRAEAALLGEIAAPGPLAHPDRFEQSHRLAMRALEVADRGAWKHPRLLRLGPLSGAAESGVELVARTIVQGHVADVVRALSRLYARREAQSQPASPERRMLVRARIQADRLALGYQGGGFPLPTVLIGGAAVPVLASASRQFGALQHASTAWVVAGGVVLVILFVALAWVLLQGAGLAHRRIRATLNPSLAALYQTIGHCGHPPEDDSSTIAAAALALTAIAWFVVPIAIAVLATLF